MYHYKIMKDNFNQTVVYDAIDIDMSSKWLFMKKNKKIDLTSEKNSNYCGRSCSPLLLINCFY